jgi:hypothetical protein
MLISDVEEAEQTAEWGGVGLEQSEHSVLGNWIHFRING